MTRDLYFCLIIIFFFFLLFVIPPADLWTGFVDRMCTIYCVNCIVSVQWTVYGINFTVESTYALNILITCIYTGSGRKDETDLRIEHSI